MADVTFVNSTFSHNPSVPLGALYLTSYLETHGYQVDFRDYQLCCDPDIGTPGQFAMWLSGSAPIVAFSTLSSSLPLILATLSRQEFRDRSQRVVLGGPGVNNLGPRILELFPAVDVVASGEGEETLLEVVRRLRDGFSLENVLGIAYRDGATIRRNPPRSRIRDLGKIPYPAYEHVDMREYSRRAGADHIPLGVLSARGCPYACTFCDIPGVWGGCTVSRSVTDVIDEVELLKAEFAIPRLHIVDDTFVLSKDRVLEFCRRLEERAVDLPWSCFGRVDLMDREILEALASANCERVFYGIESGSDLMLERIDKRFTVEQAFSVVRQTLAYMQVDVSFIWGFPFEQMEDFYDTIIALLDMQQMGAESRLNMLAPLPSAEMSRAFRKEITRLRGREVGWALAMTDNYDYSEELDALIEQFPDIFAPFYCLRSPDFERKVELLESWGLGYGKPSAPSQPSGGGLTDSQFLRRSDSLLPGISDRVVLRRVGGKHFVLDSADCLLYEPGPKSVMLFEACQRGGTLDEVTRPLCNSTGCSTEEAKRFVLNMLRKFAERGFLTGFSTS